MLNEIKSNLNKKIKIKRLGRGIGTGKGKTCGKGHKGQKARSGTSTKNFEGGQVPVYIKLPKRGFFGIKKKRKKNKIINIDKINRIIEKNKLYNKRKLDEKIYNKLGKKIKILAKGEYKYKFTISANKASKKIIELNKEKKIEVLLKN